MTPQVQPLSYKHRNLFFYLLAGVFVAALPFLFLYATGYRFHLGDQAFISTGGLYVAADRTGAQIYIDNELVRETRVFRRAFYAQGLEAITHRVHVQKEDHHTWVKELPVYPHLVTEAQSFNLPLTPRVRLITPWQTTSNIPVLTATSSVLVEATTTTQYLFEPRAVTSSLTINPEFTQLMDLFATSTATSTAGIIDRARQVLSNSDEEEIATTTKEWRGVRLFQENEDVYATYVGNREQMPYYYCAEPFPRWTPATDIPEDKKLSANVALALGPEEDDVTLPVQTVSTSSVCDPIIQLDRGGEEVTFFDFFPGSTDLIVIATTNGAYVVEVDDRAWQNKQPLLLGEGLEFRVANGTIYTYDGENIYELIINQDWF